jgi:hypothetical protein
MILSPKLLEEATHFEDRGRVDNILANTYHYKIIIKNLAATIVELKLDKEDYLDTVEFLHEYFQGLWTAKN